MKISSKGLSQSINIEDYLHRIDLLFKDKTKKDIYMSYIMVFGIIFAFAYLLFWDTSESEFKQKTAQISSINTKIEADKIFLQMNPKTKIIFLEQEIENSKIKLLMHKDNNNYIKSKLETISSLIYDERTWGEYLYSISTNAQKYNIKMINFTSKNNENASAFGHMLDINIKSTGKFKNTLKFINSLEQNDLVVDVHGISIKAENKLNTDLNLSVWGIIY